MKFSQLIQAASGDGSAVKSHFESDFEVTGLCEDSRLLKPGDLFVSVPPIRSGAETEVAAHIAEAISKGAVAVAIHAQYSMPAVAGVAWVYLDDFNVQIGRICREFWHHPTSGLKVYGVTGTNGKSTTSWILQDALTRLGEKAAYLGTLGLKSGDTLTPLRNTTPFTVELYNLLSQVRDEGATALAMEVSSHALSQYRSDGVEFDVALFTNLTQDHLDYHGSMESYAAAKYRLFGELLAKSPKADKVAIFNGDDPLGMEWSEIYAQKVGGRQIMFSLHPEFRSDESHMIAEIIEVGLEESTIRLHFMGESEKLRYHLGGMFNVQNMLAAAAALCGHYPLDKVVAALSKVSPVPGRLEPIANKLGITVLVDYAHTPDALAKAIDSVRSLAHGKVTTVFGCGGDRDKTKRAIMGEFASIRSDLTILTSDNPRSEDPASILDDIDSGVVAGRNVEKILDRGDAIRAALTQAKAGDAVLIAGKGHEDYQIIGSERVSFDDRAVARAVLAELEKGAG